MDLKKLENSQYSQFQDCELIIHLAAMNDMSNPHEAKKIQDNLQITKNVLKLAKALAVPLIFPSSASVYLSKKDIIRENDSLDLQNVNVYVKSKIEEEFLLLDAFNNGLTGEILRLGTIFGYSPGMRFHTAINRFCWDMAMGKQLEIWESSLNQIKPYLGLEDFLYVLQSIISSNKFNNGIYNVVSENLSMQEILRHLQSVSENNLDFCVIKNSRMTNGDFYVSVDKLNSENIFMKQKVIDGINETLTMLKCLRMGPK